MVCIFLILAVYKVVIDFENLMKCNDVDDACIPVI